MDYETRQKYERLTEAYNNLSEAFIKFSLAYDAAQRALEAQDQPQLPII